MKNEDEKLGGRYVLISISGSAEVISDQGSRKSKVSGALALELLGVGTDIRGVRVERFGLAVSGVDARSGPTGTITVLGDRAGAALRADGKSRLLDLEIPGRLNYESLDRAHDRPVDKGCYYLPEFEPCSTRITLSLYDDGKGLRARAMTLRMVAAGDGFAAVRGLTLKLKDVDLHFVNPDSGNANFDANSPYDPCLQVNRRRLRCRPVAFRDSAGDPNPSGGTIAAQFATAQTVWNKACMDIEVLSTQMITDATLKSSSDLTAIRASFTDPDPDVIEVYFVSNTLPAIGGGSAGAIGVASCKVVMAEPNAGNPVLLSHELGHVLGLLHPPGTASEPGTVMQPTGSASNPGTEIVTHPMVLNIATPVLQTTTTPCCLSHDTGDHYIRDFPADMGQEPSDPLPSGMTRYSMSNVWNRRSNTPGSWSATTGPAHESPYRFANDGVTPAQNYFFARVEQLNSFSTGSPQVRFYLKTPGSGSGASLTNLGTAPVAAGLQAGLTRDAVLSWSVPSGAPSHSCCFGVVFSAPEPENDPIMLTWAQFEDMSRQDNDWAQRNLDILDVAPNSGSGNVFEAPPWIVELPDKADLGRASLSLGITATGKIIKGLEIEIPGVDHFDVKPGRPVKLETKKVIREGERVAVIIRAALDPKSPRGETGGILIDPVLGKTVLVGFGTRFRVTDDRTAKRMLLDRTIAAAWDVAAIVDEAEWYELAHDLRGLANDRIPHLAALAGKIGGSKALRRCVETSARWRDAPTFDLAVAGKRLIEAIEQEDAGAINAGLGSFLGRAHLAAPSG